MKSNNIKNLCQGSPIDKKEACKHYKRVEIPPQLANFPGARFIIIDKTIGNGKKPKEKGWPTDKNYAYGNPKLQGHIRGGGNYGIATGFGWLHCIDADEMDRLEELGIIAKLPETFTVLTGGKGKLSKQRGRHYWYEIEGMQKRIIGYDPEIRDPENPDNFLHLLDIQSRGNYAIGPNSIHKSGRRYEVINHAPIAKLEFETLLQIISSLRLKRKDDRQARITTRERKASTLQGVDLERIGSPRGQTIKYMGSNGEEIMGTHPFHGSTTGKNFSLNSSKGVWHCFRCDSGGGWAELLAVREGIIRCDQAGKGCLSKTQFRQVVRRAMELGLIEEKVVKAPIKEIYMDKETIKEIPHRIPHGPMIVLRAPPRTGKSHAAVQWLDQMGEGNYVTHKHAIVEHAIRIAREMKMEGVVWLIGIMQPGACTATDKGKCATCPLRHTKENHFEIEKEARKLLKEKKVLTVKDIPLRLCPYHTLKAAEKYARFCFTVVNNIGKIKRRKCVIIDEDPVMDHFYPNSIEIASMKTRTGDTANKNFLAKSAKLQMELKKILVDGKKPMLREYALMVRKLSSIIDKGIEAGKNVFEIADDIDTELLNFNPKHREVREEGELEEGEEISLEKCVRCLGHLYKENPVSIVQRPGGYSSIYLLGDERKPVYDLEWMSETEKIIIIGATKAELFSKEFGGRELEVKDFRYDDRFVLIGIDQEMIGDQRGKKNAQKKKIIDIANGIWRNSEEVERRPFLVLTGSRKEQEKVAGQIRGAAMARSEREEGMDWEYISGKPVTFYQNSIISRGLDVDQYNLLLIYGSDFAQPFWSEADQGIADAIISDETTNSALRISSTLRKDNHTLKVVLIPKHDLGKVRYLHNVKIISEDAKKVAAILRELRVTGLITKSEVKGSICREIGTNFESGNNKLLELLEDVDDISDSDELEMAEAIILDFMKRQKSYYKRVVFNTTKLIEGASAIKNVNVVRNALKELYRLGLIRLVKRGKENMWSLASG
jgi:hypothetical protein